MLSELYIAFYRLLIPAEIVALLALLVTIICLFCAYKCHRKSYIGLASGAFNTFVAYAWIALIEPDYVRRVVVIRLAVIYLLLAIAWFVYARIKEDIRNSLWM